jgi:hypothetical protein
VGRHLNVSVCVPYPEIWNEREATLLESGCEIGNSGFGSDSKCFDISVG